MGFLLVGVQVMLFSIDCNALGYPGLPLPEHSRGRALVSFEFPAM